MLHSPTLHDWTKVAKTITWLGGHMYEDIRYTKCQPIDYQ